MFRVLQDEGHVLNFFLVLTKTYPILYIMTIIFLTIYLSLTKVILYFMFITKHVAFFIKNNCEHPIEYRVFLLPGKRHQGQCHRLPTIFKLSSDGICYGL